MIEADPLDKLPSPEDTEAPGGEATLHGNLVAQLRAILMEGELPAGVRIPEAQLCRRFSVSRTPLREALKVMAAEGFVILRPNRGAIVAPVDPDEIVPLFEFKGALERLIGLTAAERASPEDIAALDAIHVELKDALAQGEHDDYTRLNYAFHRGLAHATRNPVLIQAYETLQQKIWRYRFIVNEHEERLQESFAEHERIVIALRARTPLDLAERLETHNRLTGDAMAGMIKRAAEAETSKTRGKSRATTN